MSTHKEIRRHTGADAISFHRATIGARRHAKSRSQLVLLLLIFFVRAAPARAEDEDESWGEFAPIEFEDVLDEMRKPLFGGVSRKKKAVPTSTVASRVVDSTLTTVGNRELLVRSAHLGIRVGPRVIGQDIFLGVTPTGTLEIGSWSIAFQVPLNLLAVEPGRNELGSFEIRRQDWDELTDYARLIRYVTYKDESRGWRISVDALHPRTLGHGQLMDKYQPNIGVDTWMTGLALQVEQEDWGVELQLNDILFGHRVITARSFLHPQLLFSGTGSALLELITVGVEYAADLRAPGCIQISPDERRCVRGDGHGGGRDPFTGEVLDDTFVVTRADTGRPAFQETTVHLAGLTADLKLLSGANAHLVGYGAWHTLIGGGGGGSIGLVSRFVLGRKLLSGFNIRAEGRLLTRRFVFGYFDTSYEIAKFQNPPRARWQVAPTKRQAVVGDPGNGFVLDDDLHDLDLGFDLELTWALFTGSTRDKPIAISVGLSDSNRRFDTRLFLHTEVALGNRVELFFTFMSIDARYLREVFATDRGDRLLLSGARLRLWSFLHLNAHYSFAYQSVHSAGSEIHLGNEHVVDEFGHSSTIFDEEHFFESVHTLSIELELGIELSG